MSKDVGFTNTGVGGALRRSLDIRKDKIECVILAGTLACRRIYIMEDRMRCVLSAATLACRRIQDSTAGERVGRLTSRLNIREDKMG